MLKRAVAVSLIACVAVLGASPALADNARPGQSMTHMKTAPGLLAQLESAGVVVYVQGGATAAVMGDSIASANGQMVLHIPVTESKGAFRHTGSNIVLFNTANDRQAQLRNPTINLKKGIVTAVVTGVSDKPMTVLSIPNAQRVKAKVTTDPSTGITTTTYAGVKLVLAPGINVALASLLGLPEGALPARMAFGSAEVTLYGKG